MIEYDEENVPVIYARGFSPSSPPSLRRALRRRQLLSALLSFILAVCTKSYRLPVLPSSMLR